MAAKKKPTTTTTPKGVDARKVKGAAAADPEVKEVDPELVASMSAALTGEVVEIPLKELRPDPLNRTLVLDEAFLASVAAEGVLVPIYVRPVKDKAPIRYEIVAGARRFAASQQTGRKTIRAIVSEMSDARAALIQATENLRRRDLSLQEECRAIVRVLDYGIPAEVLAERIGEDVEWVQNRLKLLALPDKAFAAVDDKSLSVAMALRLTAYDEAVVAKITDWHDHSLRWKLDDIDRNIRARAKQAELRAKGLTVVKSRPQTWGRDAAERVDELLKDKKDRTKHQKLPCHVAFYDASANSVTHYCKNPASHREPDNPTGVVASPKQQNSGFNERRESVRARYALEIDPHTAKVDAWRSSLDPTAKHPAAISASALLYAAGGLRGQAALVGCPSDQSGWDTFPQWLATQKTNVIMAVLIGNYVSGLRRGDAVALDRLLAEYDVAVPPLPTIEEWAAEQGLTEELEAEGKGLAAVCAKVRCGEEPTYEELGPLLDEQEITDAAIEAITNRVAVGLGIPDWLMDLSELTDVELDAIQKTSGASGGDAGVTDAADGADAA